MPTKTINFFSLLWHMVKGRFKKTTHTPCIATCRTVPTATVPSAFPLGSPTATVPSAFPLGSHLTIQNGLRGYSITDITIVYESSRNLVAGNMTKWLW